MFSIQEQDVTMSTPHQHHHDTCQASLYNRTWFSSTHETSAAYDTLYHLTLQMCSPFTCFLVVLVYHLGHLFSRNAKSQRHTDRQDEHRTVHSKDSIGFEHHISITSLNVCAAFTLALVSAIQVILGNGEKDEEAKNLLSLCFEIGGSGSISKHAYEGVLFGTVGFFAVLERIKFGYSRPSLPLLAFWATNLVKMSSTLYSHFTLTDIDVSNNSIDEPSFTLHLDAIKFMSVCISFCLSCINYRLTPSLSSSITSCPISQRKIGMPGKTLTMTPSQEVIHPEDCANWWSNVTLSWADRCVWIGFRRNLEENDVPNLASSDKCRVFVPGLQRNWKLEKSMCTIANDPNDESSDYKHLNKSIDLSHKSRPMKLKAKIKVILKDNMSLEKSEKTTEKDNTLIDQSKIQATRKPSLLKALLRTFGVKFFILQITKCFLEMGVFIEPLLTAALMNHIQNRKKESSWNGVIIVTSMFLVKCLLEIANKRLWFSITRYFRYIRNGVIMLVFKKSLTLQNEDKKDKTTGGIINLISEDCDRLYHMGIQVYVLIMAPMKICVSLFLLHNYLGWSMLVGILILFLLIPLNSFIASRMKDLNNRRTKIKDRRVGLMNEIINGIKILKLYAWEKCFAEKVDDVRREEIEMCMQKSEYHAAVDSMFRTFPYLVKVGVFGAFLLLGGRLDATKGFVAVTLFHTFNHPLSLMTVLMPDFSAALLSLRRINEFLNGNDISHDITGRDISHKVDDQDFSNNFNRKDISPNTSITDIAHTIARNRPTRRGNFAIRVKNGSFGWERLNTNPTLTGINFSIPKGGLVAVVGMVGSGKSSLLSAILGEIERLDGEVEIQGRLAYVPQEAWILNAIVRDNVLFGSEMEQTRYGKVVTRCCLDPDIDIMAAGDRTEIGEKGINLSGGQKQRVSLARAVYSDADVYLLDDPLSAVDAHVGKRIFNEVISHQGLLNGKTRILVTHGIHLLPFVDSIIVMKDGQVSEIGTYHQLLSRKGAFANLLRDLCSHSSKDDTENMRNLKQKIVQQLNSNDVLQDSEKLDIKHLTEDVSDESSSDDRKTEAHQITCDSTKQHSNGKLIKEEEVQRGNVKISIYLDYLKSFGFRSVTLSAFIFLVTVVAENYETYIIKQWSDDSTLAPSSISQSCTASCESGDRSWRYFRSFAVSGMIKVVSAFVFISLTMKGAFKAAKHVHDKLLDTILKCPMSFFETTPSSRILNRFSTDVGRVDDFGLRFSTFIERFITLVACLVLMVYNAPVIFLCLLPICVLYYLLHRIQISTVRQLSRYRSKHRSPVLAHFSETLNGVASIRAYTCQERFTRRMEERVEELTKFEIMNVAVQLWFSMRMAFLYLSIQMIAGLVVVMDTRMTAGMAGLVLTHASEFAGKLGGLIGLMTHMETQIVSLERILAYAKNPTEAPWEILQTKPASDWPSEGHVVFNDLKLRYREGLDLVLKGVNCDVKGGEKVGIVGRTGAGKSSLAMALFRLMEVSSGHIRVDGENTSNLGLHDLRSKITILPQEPVIFAGTLRMNLDPFHRHTAEEMWTALQHSHLKTFVESLPNQLEFECGEGGKDLSVGQRQLLCLARTLLRKTNILILDEATASVDMETDELIQKTIRSEFKECTVLTIAHRLNTVLDYDRILVLDQGRVKEFDSPCNLLSDKRSTFYGMARDAKLVT